MTHSFLTLLFFCLCCCISLTQALNGFSVELIHRDSSKSPLYNPTETPFQRVANVVRRSINYANHFSKASLSTNTPVSTVTPDKEHIETFLAFQTRQSVRDTSCSSSNQQNCEYAISYGDGSQSEGDLSVDTLTLDSTIGSPVSFPKTVIGCGHNNTMSFQGKSSGKIGLGGGPVSLITQLSSLIGGKFSYSLVPMFSEAESSSKLNFGDAAVVSGQGTVSTPIIPSDSEILYLLNLEAFSVGNNRIEYRGPSYGSSGDGNILIDSGTTLVVLPYDYYSTLESAVIAVVKLERIDDHTHQLNLCYKALSHGKLDVPVITAHFSGADVKLNALSTFIEVADGVVCFAFSSIDDGAIFGNLAQQNLLVGYDLRKKILSFKPTDCTKQ